MDRHSLLCNSDLKCKWTKPKKKCSGECTSITQGILVHLKQVCYCSLTWYNWKPFTSKEKTNWLCNTQISIGYIVLEVQSTSSCIYDFGRFFKNVIVPPARNKQQYQNLTERWPADLIDRVGSTGRQACSNKGEQETGPVKRPRSQCKSSGSGADD